MYQFLQFDKNIRKKVTREGENIRLLRMSDEDCNIWRIDWTKNVNLNQKSILEINADMCDYRTENNSRFHFKFHPNNLRKNLLIVYIVRVYDEGSPGEWMDLLYSFAPSSELPRQDFTLHDSFENVELQFFYL